jgi:hypothetical protein
MISAMLALLAAPRALATETFVEVPQSEKKVVDPDADGPPARTGFQAQFRTGVSIPGGLATGDSGDSLARRYAWQIPFAFDLGAKITRHVYIGSYLHLGFGAEGSDAAVEDLCDDDDQDLENDVSCNVVTVRLGLDAQYHFAPAAAMNPWLGYGIGFEAAVQSLRDTTGYRENNTASGITWAQLSGGLDFRHGVGIGPFAELALGRFTRTRTEVNQQASVTSIDDRAFHVWATIGLRMVVRP